MITSLRALRLRAGLVGAALMLAATQSFAAYPDKPIRLVVPFAPGGGTDLIARTLGAGMSTELGQQVIVDNKPGAGTIIGTDAVAKSAPDGYTIVIATFAHAVNPSLQPKLPYAHDKAFTPVTLIGEGPNVLVVRADSPYKTVEDIVAAAKAKPGKLTYASQGNGTSAHLAGEMFTNLAKVRDDPRALPRRGTGDHRPARRPGRHDLRHRGRGRPPSSNSGKLRALGGDHAAAVAGVQGRAADRRDGARLRGRELVRPLCARPARRRR